LKKSQKSLDFGIVPAYGVIHKFKGFWETHFIRGIPDSLLNNIGDLSESKIIKDEPPSKGRAFENYLKHLKNATEVFHATSSTNSIQLNAIIQRLKDNVPVEFVYTNDVSKSDEFIEKIDELKKYKKLKPMVIQYDIKVGLTVTDTFLSFGLYKFDGTCIDCDEDLFSYDQKAIDWGRRLFEHYKAISIPQEFPR
jgi:predicted transcriptional regulator